MEILSPLSNSSDVIFIESFRVDELIEAWKKKYDIDVTSELNGHNEISLYQCCDTKLNFFMPLDIFGSDVLYKHLEKLDWYYMPNKWEHNVAVKELSDCHKVLEVGCGKGYFVKRLCQEHGLAAQGIELNPAAVHFARTSNIPVTQKDLYELMHEKAEYFDAVCAFQVLEHVPQPKQFLKALVSLVRPGGTLIISVPNSESFSRFSDNNLLDMPPHHMTQWCETSFRSLPSIFPLEIKSFQLEPLAKYHIDWYISAQIYRLAQGRVLRKILSKLARFSVRKVLQNSEYIRNAIAGHTLYVSFQKRS